MNLFLIFAFVLATILLAIVLERVLSSPTLIAISFFAIYLLSLAILFATGVITNLAVGIIAVIILSIIAFVTAVLARFIRCICRRFLGDCCKICPNQDVAGDTDENEHNGKCCCQNRNIVATIDDRNRLDAGKH